jgi:hypothetical protein
MTAFVLPNATNKGAYGIEGFAVGPVAGSLIVAVVGNATATGVMDGSARLTDWGVC